MKPYILVHGASAGGWFWRQTAQAIATRGHPVFTPTLTGLGERVHLASPAVGLEIHLQDIINVLEFEDLHDVVLVGYSYSGIVVTGVAARVPERLSQLIYLDAYVPQPGQSICSMIGPEFTAAALQLVQAFDGFRYPLSPDAHPFMTPMLLKPCIDALEIAQPERLAALPCAFIYCTGDKDSNDLTLLPITRSAQRVRGEPGWRYEAVPYGHLIALEEPQFLADLLLNIGQPAAAGAA